MAGELLIQTFDEQAYRDLLPVLDQLDVTLDIDSEGSAALRRALAAEPSALEGRSEARAVLERMLRHPELRPRWLLGPRELRLAVDALVFLLCFQDSGAYSLVEEVGASWVVLDAAQRYLVECAWYEEMFLSPEPCGARLEFPKGGNARYRKLRREDLERLRGELDALVGDCQVYRQFPESIRGLRRLVATAGSSRRLSLVYRILP
jgi:hypothetical protein